MTIHLEGLDMMKGSFHLYLFIKEEPIPTLLVTLNGFFLGGGIIFCEICV